MKVFRLQRNIRTYIQKNELIEFILLILIIGFFVDIIGSAVYALFEKGLFNEILNETRIILLSVFIIFLVGVSYLLYKGKISLKKHKTEKKKEQAAIDYMMSLTFNFLIRLLLNLQEDTKNLQESTLKNELQRPIMFTSSMIEQKRPSVAFDTVFVVNLILRWRIVASEEFYKLIEQMIEKMPIDRWVHYGEILKEMLFELNNVYVFEEYLPIETTIIILDLQAASMSFNRCALIMPLVLKKLYGESKIDEVFFQASAHWLHLAFKSILSLSEFLLDDYIRGRPNTNAA